MNNTPPAPKASLAPTYAERAAAILAAQTITPVTLEVTLEGLKAHNPCADGLLELSQERHHLRIISRLRTSLTQVARSARKHHVFFSRFPALRIGDNVVKVEYTPLGVKKLKHATFGNFCFDCTQLAMLANSFVAFSNRIANSRRYISRIRHATSIAFILAKRFTASIAAWNAITKLLKARFATSKATQ